MEPSEPVIGADRPTAAPPPPPPPPSAVASRTVITTIPTAGNVLRSFVAPLASYAIAVAASMGLMVLLVIALAIQDGGENEGDPSGEIDIEAIGTLIGMPFQFAGMALGGSIQIGDADFNIGLYAPPLLITAVFAFAAYRLSKRSEKTAPSSSTTERAILAASGGLGTAVVAMVLTRLLAMRDDGVAMHSATISLFFGAFLLAGGAGFLGRLAATGSLWPRWLPADARRATHLVAQHVISWVAIAIPIVVVWMLIESGPEAALYSLVWAPTLAFGAFALGHLGAITALGEHQFAWQIGWVPGIILPLLAVALTVVTSMAWHLRRDKDRAVLSQPASWVWLPASYSVAALIVCLLSTVRLSGAFYGVGGGVSFHNAYWLIPVLAMWGAAIEALSRFVAPPLARALPSAVSRRLAKGPAQVFSSPAGPTERIPMSPADRARAKKGLIGAAVVGGLGLFGAIGVSIVGATAFSPEHRAEAYLDALVDGDAEEALSLAPVDGDEASEALLSNKVYAAAEDRITDYEISDVEEEGNTVTVTVDLEGVEDGNNVELILEKDGRQGVLFSDWKVADGGLASQVTVSVPEASTTLLANGIDIPASGGEDLDLWALPGSYAFNPYGESKWLEASESRTIVPASESYGLYAEVGDPEPSAELKETVDSTIAEWVNGCMAVTEADPADCPQDAYPSGEKQRKVVWTLVTMPTVSWDNFSGAFPVELYSDTTGEATLTYEYDASYGYGAAEWTEETEESSLYVSVTVDLVNDEPQVSFDVD